MRTITLRATAAMALLLPATATAQAEPHGGRLAAAETLTRAARVAQDLLAGGTVSGVVRSAGVLDPVVRDGFSSVSSGEPSPRDSSLSAAVAYLLGAIRTAGRLSLGAMRGSPAEIDRALARARRLSRREHMQVGSRAGHDGERRALVRRIEALVDVGALAAAGMTVAAAIDRALPALRAADAGSGAEATPCDVAAQGTDLCVSGEGDHTYTTDYGLLIDLGGNDLYRNSAGGARGLGADGLPTGMVASILIDMEGDDRYEEAEGRDEYAPPVQGSGFSGGVGILVDELGDDSYSSKGWAQAMSIAGFGMLLDRDGDDSYAIVNHDPGMVEGKNANNNYHASAQGQVYVGAGVGILADQGSGEDSFLLESMPAPVERDGHIRPGFAYVNGQGYAAAGGSAVFFDGGGPGELRMIGRTDPRISGDRDQRSVESGFIWSSGQGYADFGATTLHLSGAGDTERSMVSQVSFGYLSYSEGQGYAGADATAVFEDRGGNDSYVLSASRETVRSLTLDDTNATGDHVYVSAYAPEGPGIQTAVFGLGHASGESAVLFHDEAGDDTYETETRVLARATARNELPGLPADPDAYSAEASAIAGGAYNRTIGSAAFDSVALFRDDAGNDAYTTSSITEAHAVATAAHPEARLWAGAVTGYPEVIGQGAAAEGAYAEFTDGAGDDRYTTLAFAESTTEPEGGAVDAPERRPWTWGTVFGAVARFHDIGGTDTFTSDPVRPACVGTRGQAAWADCGIGAGIGSNL